MSNEGVFSDNVKPASPEVEQLRLVCAWCRKVLREGAPGAIESHGICQLCRTALGPVVSRVGVRRRCRGCDGTGVKNLAAVTLSMETACGACLGSGRIAERIPTKDALWDAATLERIAEEMAWRDELAAAVHSALQMADSCWDMWFGRPEFNAHAAFLAVPSLRGGVA